MPRCADPHAGSWSWSTGSEGRLACERVQLRSPAVSRSFRITRRPVGARSATSLGASTARSPRRARRRSPTGNEREHRVRGRSPPAPRLEPHRPRGQRPLRRSGRRRPSRLPWMDCPERFVSMSSPVTLAGATVAPPPIFRAAPPYERLEPLLDLPSPGPGAFGRGTVWLLTAVPRAGEWQAVAEWLLRLRSAYPPVTIGVLLSEDVDPRPLLSASALSTARVRAVLRRGEPVTALRGRMTRPTGLGAEIVEWLRLVGILLRPRVATGIQVLFDSDRESMAAALARSRLSQRTLRRRFARCGLPQPREWYAAARALRAALRLQADSQTSLLRVALDSGYGDHATFIRQIRRLFDLRPVEIRGTLGWEWMLHRWVSRWAPATRARAVNGD